MALTPPQPDVATDPSGIGGVVSGWWARTSNALKFIRFSHTVFALPFALSSMLLAAKGLPPWDIVLKILLCMVGARTAAMAYNRYADWEIDRLNPRTADRQRLMSRRGAWGLTLLGTALFLAGAWSLNRLCFLLTPLALALILGYSLAKRFTVFAHAILGLALAAAPMGAWAAVRGTLWDGMEPWLLALATALWVFGFDLIYATLDAGYDRRAGLYSIPAKWGERAAMVWAQWLHAGAWCALGGWAWAAGFGWAEWSVWGGIGGVLAWEHWQARPGDVAAVNRAFFGANAVVSGLVLLQSGIHVWN